MTQSSTFEMSTPSEIDESSQIKPNETPVCMTCLENDELTMVVISNEEYEQLKTLEQNVSTLTQQTANSEQRVLALERECTDMTNEVITLKRQLRDLQSETNRKAQECEAKKEQVEKLEQQLQVLKLKYRAGQAQAETRIIAPDKCPRPLNEESPRGNFRSYTRTSGERISKFRPPPPNASFSELYKYLQSLLASSRVQDQRWFSPHQFVDEPELGTPKPPVEYVDCGRRGVINHSLDEFYPLELGDEKDAYNISEIEGAHFVDGIWFLYSRKSSTTYFEFNRATVAKVYYEMVRSYAYKYQIWGVLAKPLK
ncbi:hypothetical protein DICA3_E04126 [Diutina catenulata]